MKRFILHCAWSPFVSFLATGMKGLRLRNYSIVFNLNLQVSQYDLFTIGPLELTVHVVQNRQAGEQKSHWDKTNKGNYHLKLCCLLFVLSRCDFCSPAQSFVPREWLAAKGQLQ